MVLSFHSIHTRLKLPTIGSYKVLIRIPLSATHQSLSVQGRFPLNDTVIPPATPERTATILLTLTSPQRNSIMIFNPAIFTVHGPLSIPLRVGGVRAYLLATDSGPGEASKGGNGNSRLKSSKRYRQGDSPEDFKQPYWEVQLENGTPSQERSYECKIEKAVVSPGDARWLVSVGERETVLVWEWA